MAKKIIGGIGKIALGTVGSILGVGGKKKAAPAAPAAQGPIVMPLADDDAVMRAKKKVVAAQLARGGRSSTILSDTSGDTLGG